MGTWYDDAEPLASNAELLSAAVSAGALIAAMHTGDCDGAVMLLHRLEDAGAFIDTVGALLGFAHGAIELAAEEMGVTFEVLLDEIVNGS